MKGYVETPENLADLMVEKLFNNHPPQKGDRILYPGCGRGPFIAAVHRYCESNELPVPEGVAIELDFEHLEIAKKRHSDKNVEVQERDFLSDTEGLGEFKYVIGNPPYVPIEGLDEQEKEKYRRRFKTAERRFDLYMLFFEQALNLLEDRGRLCFVTPEKFEYTETTEALRGILSKNHVKEIHHLDEDSFGELVTYPAVTTIDKDEPGTTRIITREDEKREVNLSKDGSSWASRIRGGVPEIDSDLTLEDVSERISCGVATGADKIFVMDEKEVPPQLERWAYPTTSGKQLRINDGPDSGQIFLSPYDEKGNLMPESELGEFKEWVSLYRNRLEDRSCYKKDSKPWYAWHERPPMDDIMKPKLLCRDVTGEPRFWKDESGEVMPRHSVYYIVPEDGVSLDDLQQYLNSQQAKSWLEANAQRAANDFMRLQSKVLKKLPVPEELANTRQVKLTHAN